MGTDHHQLIMLPISKDCSNTFLECSFIYSAPCRWNKLSEHIRTYILIVSGRVLTLCDYCTFSNVSKINLVHTTVRSQTYRKIQHVIVYSSNKYEIQHMRIASIVSFDNRLKQLLKVVKNIDFDDFSKQQLIY